MIKKSILFFTFLLISGILLLGCVHKRSHGDSKNKVSRVIKIQTKKNQKVYFNKVSVYIDNTYSMFPYERGTNDFFRIDINKLFDLLNNTTNSPAKWKFFAINSKVYPLKIGLNYFTAGNKVYTNTLRKGKLGYTDFYNIFKKLNSDSKEKNELRIFITDLIYSTQKQVSGASSVAASFQSLTEREFKEFANKNIGLIIMKMSSHYHGFYYPNFGGAPKKVEINQERPYYILIFGNNNVINTLIKNREFDNHNYLKKYFYGFKHYLVFSSNIDQDTNLYYSAFPYSKKPSKFYISRDDAKNKSDGISTIMYYSRYKGGKASFYLGADLNSLPLFKSYMTNKSNYEVYPYTVTIDTILGIHDVNLAFLDQSRKLNCSQVFTLNVKNLNSCIVKLSLVNKLPQWVYKTNSLKDGVDKTVGKNTTFGFLNFMTGIKNAYYRNQNYFTIKLNLKQ